VWNFLRELRANPMVTRIAAIAALGGFLFGYDTGVISGALLYIKRDFHAGPVAQEIVVSILLLGAVIGAIASGYLADRIGRRDTEIIAGVVYVIGAIGCAVAVDLPMLAAFRLVLGLAVGAASFVAPMYISEVAEPRVRGGLTSFNQLAVTVGIAGAYVVDYAFKDAPGNWRWMVGVAVLPGALLAAGMATVPRTPRWLVEHGRSDEARRVLRRLRAGSPDTDADRELGEITDAVANITLAKLRDLLSPRLRPVLAVGIALAVFQQIVGVNTVIYYAPTILTATGLNAGSAITQTLAIGVTNVVFTIAAVVLIDRVGRRPLLIGGTIGLGVALLALAAYFGLPALRQTAPWLALAGLLLYIASFAVGLGPVFWLMISEIFPQRVRSKAMSATTVANWAANFAVSATFLTLVGLISRPGTFLLYAAVAVVAVVFFWRRVPETKNRSLEDIQRELTDV
jgi:sugar porter (SP) family MFS transporter